MGAKIKYITTEPPLKAPPLFNVHLLQRDGQLSNITLNISTSSQHPTSPYLMPKHVPTFKHLLYSSKSDIRQQSQPQPTPQRRRPGPRGIPPYIVGENVWSPNTSGGVDATLLMDLDNGAVHPHVSFLSFSCL